MKVYAALASALFAASLSSVAIAGPVVDAAERAEDLLQEGQTLEALDALDGAIEAVWAESPLLFREVAVVESSSGHGIYEKRADAVFQPDEKLRVYVEPVGYGFGSEGDLNTIAFTADVAIRNTTGQVLVEVEEAFSIEVETANEKREFSMTLSYGVPYLRPGDYVSVFTVADENSDKTGSFEVPFTVAAPIADATEGGDPAADATASAPEPAATSPSGKTESSSGQ